MGTGDISVASNSLLGEWINECTYQLASIGGIDTDKKFKDGTDSSTSFGGLTKTQRQNIRANNIAIVLKFTNGPPVILGGTTHWGGTFTGGHFDDLATQLTATGAPFDGYKKVKFCKEIIAPLGIAANGTDFPVDFLTNTSNLATWWSTDNQGGGWGVTIGSLAGITSTDSGNYEGTIAINNSGDMEMVDGDTFTNDTVLYTNLGSGWLEASNPSDHINSGQWGVQEEQTGADPTAIESMNAYNYGVLENISLYITLNGIVPTVNGTPSTKWSVGTIDGGGAITGYTWHQLIEHDVSATDSIIAPAGQTEGISKLGWMGALDKTEAAGGTEPEVYTLDVNDAIQDVRVRFSLATRDADGGSSGCWAPKDLLNWAFRKFGTDNWDGRTLLPSRVSMLSHHTPFNGGQERGCWEIGTAINKHNTGLGADAGFGRIDEFIGDTGLQPADDFQKIELEHGIVDGVTTAYISILTDTLDYAREGSTGLLLEADSGSDSYIVLGEGDNTVTGHAGGHTENFAETGGGADGNSPINVNIASYLTSGNIAKDTGYTDSGYYNQTTTAAAVTIYNSSTHHTIPGGGAPTGNKVKLFINKLTLLLFDPMLYWENDSNANTQDKTVGGSYVSGEHTTHSGTFADDQGYQTDESGNSVGHADYVPTGWTMYNNPRYFFIKVLPFLPHVNFTTGDKFRLQIPLGVSTAG